ncbi:MAG: TVP38/TMEM64 family protein [Peptostreptococcaceae bacterium]
MKKNKLKTIISISVVLIGLLMVGIFMKSTGILEHMSSIDSFKVYIESFGEQAYIIFFILQLLSIIIAPIPSNVSSVAGAIVFGMWESFFITMLAIIVGSIIVFLFSRYFGRKFTDRFVNKEIYDKYEGLVNSPKGELVISLMLLLPFFPDDMINFLAGISNISFKRYMIILMLTRPWGILASTVVGVYGLSVPPIVWVIAIVMIIIAIINSNKIENKLVRFIKTI